MQNYILIIENRHNTALILLLLLCIAVAVLPRALQPFIFRERVRWELKTCKAEERYWRDLRKGVVRERSPKDLWRISHYDDIDFEDFLTSKWLMSPYWYPQRRAAFYCFEADWKFKIITNQVPSPTGEEEGKVIYRH